MEGAVENRDNRSASRQYGDVLFDLVRLARFIDVHPEIALTRTVQKFVRRFKKMEALIAGRGRDLEALSADEVSFFWQQAAQH